MMVDLVKQSNIAELVIHSWGKTLIIIKFHPSEQSSYCQHLAERPEQNEYYETIYSEFAGIYHRRSPLAIKHQVVAGNQVKVGDPICIIVSGGMVRIIKSPYKGEIISEFLPEGAEVTENFPIMILEKKRPS